MMFDIVSGLKRVRLANPAAVTDGNTATGIVSLEGYNACMFEFDVGALGGGVVTWAIHQSPTGTGDWTLLEGDKLNYGGADAAPDELEADTPYVVGITDLDLLTDNYLRATLTVTGGSGAVVGVHALLGHPVHGPAHRADAYKTYIA